MRGLFLSICWLCLSLALPAGVWADTPDLAYQLKLIPDKKIYFQGDEATFRLQLLDEEGKAATSPKPRTIALQVNAAGDQKAKQQSLDFPENSAEISITRKLDQLGLYRLTASHDELYSAVLNLVVKASSKKPAPPPAPVAKPQKQQNTYSTGSRRPASTVNKNPAKAIGGSLSSLFGDKHRPKPAARLPRVEVQKPAAVVSRSEVAISNGCKPLARTESMRPWKFMLLSDASREGIPANGKHAVTIEALISSGHRYTTRDLEIILESDGGRLSSRILRIPKCENSGKVTLTASRAGPVTVRHKIIQGIGNISLEGEDKIKVDFLAPVNNVRIKAPKSISLFEEAPVSIELVDEEGRPVQSSKYPVTFQASSQARFNSQDLCRNREGASDSGRIRRLCFGRNLPHVELTLIPAATGQIELAASALRLAGDRTQINVRWPILHLLFAAIGGLAGGLLTNAIFNSVRKNKAKLTGKAILLIALASAITGLLVFLLLIPSLLTVSEPAWLKGLIGASLIALGGGVFITILANILVPDKWLFGKSDDVENYSEYLQGGVFISYRRDDQPGSAARLADHLEKAFGKEKVFRDVESIASGENFVTALHKALSACDALLVIIGPRWLTTTTADGKRRIWEDDDWVRMEVETGMSLNKKVIPILLDDTKMPGAQDLPESLAGLCEFNAHPVSDSRWDYDVKTLIEELIDRKDS